MAKQHTRQEFGLIAKYDFVNTDPHFPIAVPAWPEKCINILISMGWPRVISVRALTDATVRAPLFIAAIWLSLGSVAWGQRVYFGVVGGTNLTANFPTTDISSPADVYGNPANRFQFLTGPRSLIFGALAEIRLSDRLAIESNVLLRPMKNTITYTDFFVDGSSKTATQRYTAVRAWEFPLTLKYALPAVRFDSRFRPFLEAGPSFRTQEDAAATEPSQFGLSAGVGVALHLGRIRIAPTVRYTRWKHESIYPKYATKPDQVEFLTSIAYQTESGPRRVAGHNLLVGVLAGFPLTRGFRPDSDGSAEIERMRYLAGLTVEINLAGNLSVEADGIYRPLNARSDPIYGQAHFSVLTWQIPVLAKYRWTRPVWTPFAEAGPSFRLAGNLNEYNPSHYGITAGAGMETRTHGIRLSPTLRYTRWATDASRYRLPPGVHYDYSRTNANSMELVLGIAF